MQSCGLHCCPLKNAVFAIFERFARNTAEICLTPPYLLRFDPVSESRLSTTARMFHALVKREWELSKQKKLYEPVILKAVYQIFSKCIFGALRFRPFLSDAIGNLAF